MSVIAPRKSLGQNFLQDENIVRKIVDSLNLQRDDVVVEIGPGTGALTKALVGQCRLSAVEIDPRAVALLRETYGETVNILETSILDVDLSELGASKEHPVRVVGNIPYNLTSDILFWVFDHGEAVRDATLMIQDEVAYRLIARPRTKDYGILSVFSQYYAAPRRLFGVSRKCFYPVPDVDSAVVHFKIAPRPNDGNDRLFRTIVRSTFGKRRKTLKNGLSSLNLSKDVVASLGDTLSRRPEELSPAQFADLARRLQGIDPDERNSLS